MHVVEGQSRERPGEVERDTAGGGRVCRTHERKEKRREVVRTIDVKEETFLAV
jgi:hypothetical protein